MPIYTYKCKECGKEFDWMQSIKSEPLTVCPDEICHQHKHGQSEVERIFSANVGLVFKGSGFYLTDYTKKNTSSSTEASKHNGSSTNGNGHNGNHSQTENKTTAKVD